MSDRNSVAVIGNGAVGRRMVELFPGAAVHDPPLGLENRDAVNRCRFAFVCVPTPERPDGRCDTAGVERAVEWIESSVIVIRSTVPPGTTAALGERYGKTIVFQPEYGPGDTPRHPFRDVHDTAWIVLGGPPRATSAVADLYATVFDSSLSIRQVDATAAELAKYMENAFLAAKVAFCNEMYDIAQRLGVDYHTLRETWLMDPRMGRSHTWVHPDDRGFGGKCLPKDLRALVELAGDLEVRSTLLEAVLRSNAERRPSP